MNLALALHLLRKDVRWRRVDLIALWVLLVGYAVMPLVQDRIGVYSSGQRWILFAGYLTVMAVVGLLMTLQLDFVQGDHPHASEGFLQTRPMGRKEFLAAKLLGWFLVAALPALTAVLVNLALTRLDLRASDYFRVGLRNLLVLLGIYGAVSMAAALLLKRRAAIALSLPILLILSFLVPDGAFLWENLSESGLARWTMESSRLLAAWAFALGLGYVLTACTLARARLSTALALLLAGIGICGLARWFWPINLVWRNDRLVVHDPARLEQLQKQTRVEVKGAFFMGRIGDDLNHIPCRTSPLEIIGESGVEFPEVRAYEATLSLSDGRQFHRSMRPVGLAGLDCLFNPTPSFQSWLDLQGTYPPIEEPLGPEAMVKALGLPAERAGELRRHFLVTRPGLADWRLRIDFAHQDPPVAGLKAHLTGRLTLDWIRAVVQAELPLQAGTSFVRDGHRLDLRGVRILDGQLYLELSIRHCRSPLHWERAFDANERMILWVANPVHGDLAVAQPVTREGRPYSRIRDVESEELEVRCLVLDGGRYSHQAHMDAQWLQQARLFVLARQHIGQTEQAFEGDLETVAPKDLGGR